MSLSAIVRCPGAGKSELFLHLEGKRLRLNQVLTGLSLYLSDVSTGDVSLEWKKESDNERERRTYSLPHPACRNKKRHSTLKYTVYRFNNLTGAKHCASLSFPSLSHSLLLSDTQTHTYPDTLLNITKRAAVPRACLFLSSRLLLPPTASFPPCRRRELEQDKHLRSRLWHKLGLHNSAHYMCTLKHKDIYSEIKTEKSLKA